MPTTVITIQMKKKKKQQNKQQNFTQFDLDNGC